MDLNEEIENTINAFCEQAGVEQEESTPVETIEETIEDITDTSNTLPTNSDSVFISEYTSRFSGAEWFNQVQSERVLLAGVGGIGSYVSFLLSRLNVERVCLFDDDTVESGNISGQLFCVSDVGKSKVIAASSRMSTMSGYYKSDTVAEKYTRNSPVWKNMICGFDNMEARRTFFYSWLNHITRLNDNQRAEYLYIDGRLAAEELQVFCIKGDDYYHIDKYAKEWLFDSTEAEETLCSYKQTSHVANMIGSIMANLFINNCYNKCKGILFPRPLPFLTIYDASLMLFKTVD